MVQNKTAPEVSSDDLMPLAEAFYDGVLAPDGWAEGLGRLARLTSSDAASIMLLNRHTQLAMVGEQVGLPAQLLLDYRDHYNQQDPGLPFADTLPVGGWYMDERDLGVANMRQSAFYQDFLRPYALDSTMASPVLRADGMEGFLSLSGRAGRRDMTRIASRLQSLLPHLQRAARLRARFLGLAQQRELSAHVLDQVRHPLLIVTHEQNVVMSNQWGQQWLSSPNNPLGSKSAEAEKVGMLLKTACGLRGVRRAASGAFRKMDGAVFFLIAVPLPAAAISSWHGAVPMSMLWINDPAQAQAPSGQLLQHIFGLTPAEIRLTRSLLQGLTLKEAMRPLDLSLETGRTQLKSVFSKLGIRRQAEMHRLLGRFDFLELDS